MGGRVATHIAALIGDRLLPLGPSQVHPHETPLGAGLRECLYLLVQLQWQWTLWQ